MQHALVLLPAPHNGWNCAEEGKTQCNLQITDMPLAFLHLSISLCIRQNIQIPGNSPSQCWPLHPPLSSCLWFASDSASLIHMYLAYKYVLTFRNSNKTSKITTILSFSCLLTIHSFHMVWMSSDTWSDCCLFLLFLCLISISLFFFNAILYFSLFNVYSC